MSNSVPQPKMFNSKRYRANYDEINWSDDLIICAECGQPRNKLDRLKYMKQDNGGNWVCIKCNWN